MLVPLFLTADIATNIIDNLLESTPKISDDESDDGNVTEFVLITGSIPEKISALKAQARGTHPPTSHFDSPYLETSVEDLTALFLEHLDGLMPDWSESVFAIADSETASNGKSVLLVYPALKGESPSEGRKPESVRIDFAEVLHWAAQIDVGNACVPELQDCVGQAGYVTAKSVEEARAKGKAP